VDHRRALAFAFTIAAFAGSGTFAGLSLLTEPELEVAPAAVKAIQPERKTEVRTQYVDAWVPQVQYVNSSTTPKKKSKKRADPSPSAPAAPTPSEPAPTPTATASPIPGLPPLGSATPTPTPTPTATPTPTPTGEPEDHDD
jgi:hypothetical protein